MVFCKPSMIKVGFLLVAGSQDQVQRMTQKLKASRQKRWPQLSLWEEVRHLAATAGLELGSREQQSHVQMVTDEPPKEKGSETGQRWVSGQTSLQLGERPAVAAEAPKEEKATGFEWKSLPLS